MPGRKSAGAIDLFVGSVKSSFDLRFFLVPILALVLGLVGVVLAAIPALPLVAASVLFAETSLDAFLAFLLAAGAVFFILVFLASAIIEGFYFKSVDEYLKTGKFSAGKNIRFAVSLWKKLFAVSLLQFLVGLAVVIIVFAPIVLMSLPVLESVFEQMVIASMAETDTAIFEAMAPLAGLIGVGMVVTGTIGLFIRPLLFLWVPAAAFEKGGALKSVERGTFIARKKYWRNFAGLILVTLLGILASGVSMIDPVFIIGFLVALWAELVATVFTVKVYRESAS